MPSQFFVLQSAVSVLLWYLVFHHVSSLQVILGMARQKLGFTIYKLLNDV